MTPLTLRKEQLEYKIGLYRNCILLEIKECKANLEKEKNSLYEKDYKRELKELETIEKETLKQIQDDEVELSGIYGEMQDLSQGDTYQLSLKKGGQSW